jgi:acetyl-CoA decarbonylase/synthase complex subunit delta
MSLYVESEGSNEVQKVTQKEAATVEKIEAVTIAVNETKTSVEVAQTQTATQMQALVNLDEIKSQIAAEIRESLTKEVVESIIEVLSNKFLGKTVTKADEVVKVNKIDKQPIQEIQPIQKLQETKAPVEVLKQSASERISNIKSFTVPKETRENSIWTVKLGNTKEDGGTRGKTYNVGGSTCMPFHLWEGEVPNKPLVAMEVFDKAGEKYPSVLREIYNDLLDNPVEMAMVCVNKYGADLISVRLDATHPERGNRSPQQAVDLVKAILNAVDVPLIITGHNNFDKNNEVMKAIAQACEGENLLLNGIEQDNYRTIAGAAMAYGHTLVAQSPIDVNIAKQINILLTNMDLKPEKIIMDPTTGAIGYGIEYTYSVMERIRVTGLNGDKMLCGPMIVSPGLECSRIKEFKAPEQNFPRWGDLAKRAALWELSTATSLLYAGADILIMYHPEAVAATKRAIIKLLDGKMKN